MCECVWLHVCVCVCAVFQSVAVALTVAQDKMFFDTVPLFLMFWKHRPGYQALACVL